MDLDLTQEQLLAVCRFAERVRSGDVQMPPHDLALALQFVALCMHRLQAGDPPVSGPEVDEWYGRAIGQDARMMWVQLAPHEARIRQMIGAA